MDALARLSTTAVTMMAQAAGLAMAVVITWKFLMLILTGGSERAFGQLLRTLLIFGISVAAITNAPQVVEIITTIGGSVIGTVFGAIRDAV